MVIRALSISSLLAVCFVFGVGCSGNEASSEDNQASESAEGDIGTTEQGIILPVGAGGGSAQCVAACTRFDPTGSLNGQCCVCSGKVKKFVRAPAGANLFLCQ